MSIVDDKNTWRTHRSVDAGILIDCRDYYLAFFEAAKRAKRSILLLGWQFDSDVPLLRGADVDAHADGHPVEFLAFLDGLCKRTPELEVRILAWDHSVVFALEREMLQKVVFDITTVDRFQFRWDDTVPIGGSHHQKVAIIDGEIAFFGSGDICQARWDDSTHAADAPLRVERGGAPYKPYHEVQVAVTGEAARSCVDLFVERWSFATGETLDPEVLTAHSDEPEALAERIPLTFPLPEAPLALARTVPLSKGREFVHEVADLHVRAIAQAEHLVYIETQYFTSVQVRDALLCRMRDADRGPLDVVMLMPRKPEKLKEEFTIGRPQAEALDSLEVSAQEGGHRLGVYNVAVTDREGQDRFVYIHSKLMMIDDRLLTIGSANMTNRSMSIDSEINAVWEATGPHDAIAHSIRAFRRRLLAEHVGEDAPDYGCTSGLVAVLEERVATNGSRLRRHEGVEAEPTYLARAVQELACEVLDPTGPAPVTAES